MRRKAIIGTLISVFFLYLAFRKVDYGDLWRALQGIRWAWLIPNIVLVVAVMWVRAWRWQLILRPIGEVPYRRVFSATMIGFMVNNILPARLGEIARAVSLGLKTGLSRSASLATIIVERIFDGVVMLAFVFVNLPELAKVASADSGFVGDIQALALWGAGIFALALVLFLLAAMFPKGSARIGQWFIYHLTPHKWHEKLIGILNKFLDGLISLRSPANVLMVFFTSVLIWLLETVKYWFVMHAFTFRISFFGLMLLNGIANLATTIPAAPGYIGTWEAVTKAVLVAYQVPGGEALGYAAVLHMALWLPITLLGVYFITREGIHWSDSLRAETTTTDTQV